MYQWRKKKDQAINTVISLTIGTKKVTRAAMYFSPIYDIYNEDIISHNPLVSVEPHES